jgi:Cu/Ag efflux pump CusA
MLQMRYSTAAFVVLALLAIGGAGGYFYKHNQSSDSSRPAAADHAHREALPPDRPAPDNSPVFLEVIAFYPGASAVEVERQVTLPLEVTLDGMPRLQALRSKSTFGLSLLQARFEPGADFHAARQEVINRLQFTQSLPPGVAPIIGPRSGGQTLRYVLIGPRDAQGRPIYTLNDLRALQDWRLEREFRRLPGLTDVSGSGGTVKRYEIVLDPDRLRRYGITLQQVMDTVARSNFNVSGDFLLQGEAALNVRAAGLLGGGADPLTAEVLAAADPSKAAALLHAAERQRLREIRGLVVATINNHSVLVEDLVEGGRAEPGEDASGRGVVVGSRPRRGRVACRGPGEFDDADVVHGVVHMRHGEDPQLLRGVEEHIRKRNATAGELLPGVRIEPYCSDSAGGAGALWVYGQFPVNMSPQAMAERAGGVAQLLREFPEVERIVSEFGSEGDLQSSNQLQIFVGLKAGPDVPAPPGGDRLRSRTELLEAFKSMLSAKAPGVDWLTTTADPDKLGLVFPGAPAENLLKIVGPDLNELERLAGPVQKALRRVPGIESVAAYRCLEQQLEFRVNLEKCKKWGVSAADVNNSLQTALSGRSLSQMIEGEKSFDIIVRWPKRLCENVNAILELPIDIFNYELDAGKPIQATPRLRLGDLVAIVGEDGAPGPNGEIPRFAAGAIYRENGRRLLPVRFSVNGRPLADARAEAAKQIAPLLHAPYSMNGATERR